MSLISCQAPVIDRCLPPNFMPKLFAYSLSYPHALRSSSRCEIEGLGRNKIHAQDHCSLVPTAERQPAGLVWVFGIRSTEAKGGATGGGNGRNNAACGAAAVEWSVKDETGKKWKPGCDLPANRHPLRRELRFLCHKISPAPTNQPNRPSPSPSPGSPHEGLQLRARFAYFLGPRQSQAPRGPSEISLEKKKEKKEERKGSWHCMGLNGLID
jgi:hypothetical protein